MSAVAQRLVFDSKDLPAELDNAARLGRWRNLFEGAVNPVDVDYLPDRPFRSRLELTLLGDMTLSRQSGTVHRFSRTQRHIAASPDIGFHFGIVRQCAAVSMEQSRREAVYSPGQALLLNGCEPAFARTGGDLDFAGVMLDRDALLDVVPEAEDLVVNAFDANSPAVGLLARYVDLISDQGVGADEAVDRHVATTVLDLVSLAVGGLRDSTEIARTRGLRAARLAQIVAEIRQNFARPGLSPQALARRLGISVRYLQDILFEGGSSFTERVLELRLQKARSMLASRRYNHIRVSDIALACGFNEVSYFNRRFRRRFGASPTQYRSGYI
jgi:AraC-like DNA-binding protein